MKRRVTERYSLYLTTIDSLLPQQDSSRICTIHYGCSMDDILYIESFLYEASDKIFN
jgi:hypothetical protein